MANIKRKQEILSYVKNNAVNFSSCVTPMSVSNSIGVSYPTTLKYIDELKTEGKIKEKKVGQNRVIKWQD